MADYGPLIIGVIVLLGCWTSFKLGMKHERDQRRILRRIGTYTVDIRESHINPSE